MQLSKLAYKVSYPSYCVDLFSCTSVMLGKRLAAGMMGQEGVGLKFVDFVMSPSQEKLEPYD